MISRLRRNGPIAARMHVVSCTQRWCITSGDESGTTDNLYMDPEYRLPHYSHPSMPPRMTQTMGIGWRQKYRKDWWRDWKQRDDDQLTRDRRNK